jgi:argininosuccinate lyase
MDQNIFLPYDLEASKAHAAMLAKQGILTTDELAQLNTGLTQIHQLWEKGEFKVTPEQEDGHTAIEQFLTENCGDAGKKIHTARSRNDQSLTMIRLYTLDQLSQLKALATQLTQAWGDWIDEHGDQPMPGYSHLQKAMPTTIGTWQGSYMNALQDLQIMMDASIKFLNQSPLGSGAGYGIPLEIDKAFTAKELGFAKVQENPIYCQLSRGMFDSQALQVCSQVMTVLGRWANDLLMFTTQEFGFFSLPKEFCTGSSIMPQKQNYDVLELMRAKVATVSSAKLEVDQLTQSLPLGYNRDLQLIKAPLIRGIQTTLDSLSMALTLAPHLTPHNDKLDAALTPDLYATEKVYEHVKKGIPFREAYKQVKSEHADHS